MLGEMGRRRRLAGAALEVDDRDHLQAITRLAMRHIFLGVGLAVLVEVMPEFQHLLGRVEPPPAGRGHRHRAFSVEMQALEIVRADAEIMRHLGHGEQPQGLLGVRRKFLDSQLIQLAGDLCSLHEDLVVKLE